MMQLTLAKRLALAWVSNPAYDKHSPLDAVAWCKFCLEEAGADYPRIPSGGAHELRIEIDRRVQNHRALCSMKAVS